MDPYLSLIVRAAAKVVCDLLAVRAGERVVIVGDYATDTRMAYAIAGMCEHVGADASAVVVSADDTRGVPEGVVRSVESSDVLVAMSRVNGAPTYSPRLYELRSRNGLRTMSMVHRDIGNWTGGGAWANYDELAQQGRVLQEVWRDASHVTVRSRQGTSLEARIGARPVRVEAGLAREPGQEAAFSDGEVSQAPDPATVNGVAFLDGPAAGYGTPVQPVEVRIVDGQIVEVRGTDPVAARLRGLLDRVPCATNIAELGLGLNPLCRRNGDYEEEKKAAGTAHLGIGSDVTYGGTVECPVHLDLVLYDVTVEFDGVTIVDAGRLVLDQTGDVPGVAPPRDGASVGDRAR